MPRLRSLFSRGREKTDSSSSGNPATPISSSITPSVQSGSQAAIHLSEEAPGAKSTSYSKGSPVQPSGLLVDARGGDLLGQAFRLLEERERAIIQANTLSSIGDIASVIDDTLHAALEKQKICNEKRWTFTVRGRTVMLREEADKVILWLDRFKQVGDIAANADPIHAGLPWAGIRLLLTAAVSESHQMAALLSGLKTALCISHRLKAYMDYLQNLPDSQTQRNFRNALIDLHAHVLQFLARAIDIYQKNSFHRAVDAFWKPEEIQYFEDKCNNIAAQVEIEASNCDRTLSSIDRAGANRRKEQLQKVLEELKGIEDIKESVAMLAKKIDLAGLPCAEGAAYDSYADELDSRCHPDTRKDLLRQIKEWAGDPQGKCIFWLNGMAGTGKSTVSRTVSQSFAKDGQLGASFFFKRGEGERGNASRFFTTIAAQLVLAVPGIIPSITKVLNVQPDIATKSLKEQFEKLIFEPLSQLNQTATCSSPLVVVVDALDECEKEEQIRNILNLLARMQRLATVHIRVFLTSRPELPIRLGFNRMSSDVHQDVVLQDIPPATVNHDISVFLKGEFARIKDDFNCSHPPDSWLAQDWPSESHINALTEMAIPLFIFAATVCRFVGDSRWNPKDRLATVLKYQQTSQASKFDKTYLPILDQLIAGLTKTEKASLVLEFHEVVGSIIVLADPLSMDSLANLLRLPREMVECRLDPLHSVLSIPANPISPIRLLHLSFREFLLDPEKEGESVFWINEKERNKILASRCLELLSRPGCLRENLCQLDPPGTLRTEIDMQIITNFLPADAQYACQYWVYHLEQSREPIRDADSVHIFLQEHLLHWLEALSIMGKISHAISLIDTLRLLVDVENCTEISRFLYDTRRFILHHRWMIDQAPLQLYSSAIIFSPQNSIVRSIFKDRIPKWIVRLPETPVDWGMELFKLEGHSETASSVSFSPDGQLLASASHDRTVKLWKPLTGEQVHQLEGHTESVSFVAFSPDGKLLASVSHDRTARLWNPLTGELVQQLEGAHLLGGPVIFSPDSKLLASTLRDFTVGVWNLSTGEIFQRHSGAKGAVAFSPDGNLLATGLKDNIVRLCNPLTGEQVHQLEGHSHFIGAIAFSPDSKLLASASDTTVRLWNPSRGDLVQQLEGHSGSVDDLLFSPNSRLLASVSHETIELWNPLTGEQVKQLEGHIGTAAFSPNSELLAIASNKHTIRLWNLPTFEQVQELEGHNSKITAVAFSPDGKLLASSSADRTVMLWNLLISERAQQLKGHSRQTRYLALSSDSQLLASASGETVRLWNPFTGEQVQRLKGHNDVISAIAFSPNGNLLATNSENRIVRLWNPLTGRQTQQMEGHGHFIGTTVFSPDSKLLALRSDETVRLCSSLTGELVHQLKGDVNPINIIAFSPDSKLLALGSYITIRLWNPLTGELYRLLEGHHSFVIAVTFSSDGKLLASASYDIIVRLWNPFTGQQVQQLRWYGTPISTIAFSPNRKLLASTSYDGTVRLWSLESAKEVKAIEIHSHVSRLGFSSDGQRLETNRGILPLSSDLLHKPGELSSNIFFDGRWISRNGQKILCLPYYYTTSRSEFGGNILALGYRDVVNFFEFKFT